VTDENHVAFPKLYGAPAYARPPRPALPDDRPFDPDALPLEAHRTPDEHEILTSGGDSLSQPPTDAQPGASEKGDLLGAARRALGLDR